MRRAMALLGMLAVAGCDAADGAPATGTAHSIDPATGEVVIVIPRKGGTATVRSGAKVPVTLPEGFSLIAGAQVTGNSLVTQPGGGTGTLLTFTTDAPAEAVIAHTRDEAEAAGFAVTLDETAGDTLILVADREGTRISVTATDGNPTSAQLVLDAGGPG